MPYLLTCAIVQDLHANVDLESFDPMTLRPHRAAQQTDFSMDVDDMDIDTTDVNAMNVDHTVPMAVDDTAPMVVDNTTGHTDGHNSTPTSSNARVSISAAPHQQSTLQTTGALAITSQTITSGSARTKRCATCVKAMCVRRWECPGTGNRAWCTCPHPRIGTHEKVRIPEKKIVAFLEARAKE